MSDPADGTTPVGATEPELWLTELLAPPPGSRSLRRMPEQLGRALRLTWAAAPRILIAVAALQILAGAGAAAQVLVAKHLLEIVLGESGQLTVSKALPSAVLLGVVMVAVRLANVSASELSRLMSGRVERHAIAQVADAAGGADLLEYERPAYHNLLQRAQVSAASRPVGMVNDLTASLGAVTGAVGVGIALAAIEPLLLALLALGAVPVWLASRRSSRALYRFFVAQTERDRQRNYLFVLLTHHDWAAEIRAFSLTRFLRARLDHLYAARLRDLARLVRSRVTMAMVGGLISAALSVATIVLLVWLVSRGHIALSAAGAAAAAILLLAERLHGLANGSGSLYENSLYMQDISTFVERWSPPVSEQEQAPSLSPFSRLDAERISFTYPSRQTPALDGVSIQIGRDEVVALVGENGSGKTTLAKILAGLYTPESGRIAWDGTDLSDLDPERLRQSVAVIFQEYGKYFFSAADNIGIGDVERAGDRNAVVEAARRAGADRFINDLPHGYDNVLGAEFSGGANLSLGQWQRIALARAYFRDAPFVILDEPTASLDPKAEAALFDNVRSLYKGRSVLLISHRFASARSADRIYVLEAGRVVEAGTHEELMSTGGLYAEMFTLQAAAYNLAAPKSPARGARPRRPSSTPAG